MCACLCASVSMNNEDRTFLRFIKISNSYILCLFTHSSAHYSNIGNAFHLKRYTFGSIHRLTHISYSSRKFDRFGLDAYVEHTHSQTSDDLMNFVIRSLLNIFYYFRTNYKFQILVTYTVLL